jgi:hypothetical protein
MGKPTIKYYPVDNGDQSLITLEDGTTILVDCKIRESSKGEENKEQFDVHADLLKSLKKDSNGIPFVDVFILTHGDQDHCLGFKTNFYQGDPSKYSDKDKKNNLIRVDAMWFSPMIAEEHTNDDEDAYQTEAERRLKLHKQKDKAKDDAGNRIRIIGYDGNTDYKDLNHLRSIPGDIVTRFNDKDQDKFSVFIHSPFKKHLTSATKDKNSTSIVFQARFKCNKGDIDYATLAMFGGDSDHYAWDTILKETKKSGKDKSEHALDWNLFLAPHHCSWSFFNDLPQKENPKPKSTSLEVLDFKRKGASVIASSKEIEDNDDNPPHYKARKEYVNRVGEEQFLNTATFDVVSGTPQTIIFEIACEGPARLEKKSDRVEKIKKATSIATGGLVQKPWVSN